MDFHGQDVTKACEKAVVDAISKSCLCGLDEVLHLKNLNEEVHIKVTLAVSDPDKINIEKVASHFPIGKVNIEAILGGMRVHGFYFPELNDKDDTIEVAIACVEVGIN